MEGQEHVRGFTVFSLEFGVDIARRGHIARGMERGETVQSIYSISKS